MLKKKHTFFYKGSALATATLGTLGVPPPIFSGGAQIAFGPLKSYLQQAKMCEGACIFY